MCVKNVGIALVRHWRHQHCAQAIYCQCQIGIATKQTCLNAQTSGLHFKQSWNMFHLKWTSANIENSIFATSVKRPRQYRQSDNFWSKVPSPASIIHFGPCESLKRLHLEFGNASFPTCTLEQMKTIWQRKTIWFAHVAILSKKGFCWRAAIFH